MAKLNGWILVAAAMFAPAVMFAGSSASAEPRAMPDVVEETPNAGGACTTNANCRTCGPGWVCGGARCVAL